MSSPNDCTNLNNLIQTPINEAYKYQTFSPYINNMKIPNYSSTCIFCSSKNTTSLVNDGGSFRQCQNCKKQFKAFIIN